MNTCETCLRWHLNLADPMKIVGGCSNLDPPRLVRMLSSDYCSKWQAVGETTKREFTQTVPSPPMPNYTWTQTTEAPKLQAEDYFIYLIENGEEKYMYCDLSIAISDMIAWDTPVQIYNWDSENDRFNHYIDLEQPE